MATIKFLLGIICLIYPISNSLFKRDFLNAKPQYNLAQKRLDGISAKFSSSAHRFVTKPQQSVAAQQRILEIARSQLGVRETTGHNDGIAVESYLSYTGNQKGQAWCASFVSWVFGKAGYKQPRTGWSPALFPLNKRKPTAMPATVFGIYIKRLKRIAHCGFVENVSGNWIITLEGNTNAKGVREGDGVYRKIRHQKNIASYADWINLNGN